MPIKVSKDIKATQEEIAYITKFANPDDDNSSFSLREFLDYQELAAERALREFGHRLLKEDASACWFIPIGVDISKK